MAVNKIIQDWQDSHEPHPSTVIRTGNVKLAADKNLIETINSYHAFCVPCQIHFYTVFNPSDKGSCVSHHLNSHQHRVKAFKFPRVTPLLSHNGQCYACCIFAQKSPVSWRHTLRELMDQHIAGGEHHHRTQNFFDREFVLLSAFAQLRKLRNLVTLQGAQIYCRICKVTNIWGSVQSHLWDHQHIFHMRNYIKQEYGFDVNNSKHIKDNDRLSELWISLGGDASVVSSVRPSISVSEPNNEQSIRKNNGHDELDAKSHANGAVKKATGAVSKAASKELLWRTRNGGESVSKVESGAKKKKERKIYFHRGIQVRPQKYFGIKEYYCDGCGETNLLAGLPNHLNACLLKSGTPLTVEATECIACKVLVMHRGESEHFESDEHKKMQEKRELKREQDREEFSRAQTSNFLMVKVLKVQGVPDSVTDKLAALHNTFKQFGDVANVTVDDRTDAPTVRFWQQAAIERALKSQPLFIDEHQLTITVGELKISEKDNISVNVTLADAVVSLLQDKEELEAHCKQLAEIALEILDDPVEAARTAKLLEDLRDGLMKNQRGQRLALVFGSRATGLTLDKNSDVDVFAGTLETYYGLERQLTKDQRNAVQAADAWLRKNKLSTEVTVIVGARVPIIRFTHRPSKLKCDLSFRNGLSVRNTEWQRLMLDLDWRVRPMVMYLKEWIRENRFTALLTSYAATIMVFVYLAQLSVPVLPTLQSLRRPGVNKVYIGDWNTSYEENKDAINWTSANNSSVVELLQGFFKFYYEMNYGDYFIYPVEALILPRKLLLEPEHHQQLPREIQHYLDLIPMEDYALKIDMCIMDPFDFSHNLTKRMRFHAHQALVECLRLSAILLTED